MKCCRITKDVVLGEGVQIFGFVNLYGCKIGDNTRVGAFVEIQKGAVIGKNCKVSSHTFICEGVTIKDNVFLGHNVTFINDKTPKTINEYGEVVTEDDWEPIPTFVEDGACIGSGTTVLCGVTIGAGAMVGAGSTVTKDVPPNETWAGNPAKCIKCAED